MAIDKMVNGLIYVAKGWDLKKGLFSFNSWCVQSELSLVNMFKKQK